MMKKYRLYPEVVCFKWVGIQYSKVMIKYWILQSCTSRYYKKKNPLEPCPTWQAQSQYIYCLTKSYHVQARPALNHPGQAWIWKICKNPRGIPGSCSKQKYIQVLENIWQASCMALLPEGIPTWSGATNHGWICDHTLLNQQLHIPI